MWLSTITPRGKPASGEPGQVRASDESQTRKGVRHFHRHDSDSHPARRSGPDTERTGYPESASGGARRGQPVGLTRARRDDPGGVAVPRPGSAVGGGSVIYLRGTAASGTPSPRPPPIRTTRSPRESSHGIVSMLSLRSPRQCRRWQELPTASGDGRPGPLPRLRPTHLVTEAAPPSQAGRAGSTAYGVARSGHRPGTGLWPRGRVSRSVR